MPGRTDAGTWLAVFAMTSKGGEPGQKEGDQTEKTDAVAILNR